MRTGMNRIELMRRIESLPLFEKHFVKVSNKEIDKDDKEKGDWAFQKKHAVCEVGKSEAYAYVYKGYELLQFKEHFHPVLENIEGDVRGYLPFYLITTRRLPAKAGSSSPEGG